MERKYSQEESEIPKVSEPAVSRVCSIKEAQHRSMTIDHFLTSYTLWWMIFTAQRHKDSFLLTISA